VKTCLICGRETAAHDDDRLPLLRVLLCLRCRDVIALDVGWMPIMHRRGRRAHSWYRDLDFKRVVVLL
jgi:hypothetical protein